MLWPDVVFIGSLVPFPLHRAKEIASDQYGDLACQRFVQVKLQQLAITLRIVPVGITDQQNLAR